MTPVEIVSMRAGLIRPIGPLGPRGIRMRFPRLQIFRATCLCFSICYLLQSISLAESGTRSPGTNASRAEADSIEIPGPLRSFLRMAGISQEVAPDQVLSMLARNVSLYGYSGGSQKEYLILLDRYVHQAREIERLADSQGVIHVSGCIDASE